MSAPKREQSEQGHPERPRSVASISGDTWWFQRRWSAFRSGTARVRLSWREAEASALLYDDGLPLTASLFLKALPLEVPVIHVAWSGEMLMSAVTYEFGPKDAENDVRLVRPGDLTWDPKYGELGFVYGTAECRLPSGPNTVVVFGSIDDGLERFASFGRQRRFEGIATVRVERG